MSSLDLYNFNIRVLSWFVKIIYYGLHIRYTVIIIKSITPNNLDVFLSFFPTNFPILKPKYVKMLLTRKNMSEDR